jgi:hypothetical protein
VVGGEERVYTVTQTHNILLIEHQRAEQNETIIANVQANGIRIHSITVSLGNAGDSVFSILLSKTNHFDICRGQETSLVSGKLLQKEKNDLTEIELHPNQPEWARKSCT